jgi:hypothetical protein
LSPDPHGTIAVTLDRLREHRRSGIQRQLQRPLNMHERASWCRRRATSRYQIDRICAPHLISTVKRAAAQIGGFLKSIWKKPWS